MKLSAMTLGCPQWDLETIVSRIAGYGYDGIDFRGIGNEIDVTRLPAFTKDVAATRRLLSDHNLIISGISSSLGICDPSRRSACMDEAARTIDVALAMDVKNIRVFGGGQPHTDGYPASAAAGVDCMRGILALPGADQLCWNLETHDFWVRSADCRLLLDAIDIPAFGIAWDVCHTQRISGETPQQTLNAIGDRLHYVHIKDAVRDSSNMDNDGWRYALPGRGELKMAEAINALHEHAYDGWLMFEHEKRWHQQLEEPEVAFPAFVQWARPVLAQLSNHSSDQETT